MKFVSGGLAATAFVLFSFSSIAAASPNFKTKYVYYPIKGKSAVELYDAMISKGPHVNGAKAYASTSATSSQEGRLVAGEQCRVIDYKFTIEFVINLPRPESMKMLKGKTRQRWEAFSTFLRKHEETHRSIWLKCAKELEQQVRAIREDDCDEVDRRAAELWETIRAQCNLKHDAFDAAEQKRLASHPFVRMVIRQNSVQTQGAKVAQTKKKKKKKVASN
jgi:predicted secreted Zn-dependent protease